MRDDDSFRLLSSTVADSIIGVCGLLGVLYWLIDTILRRFA